MLICSSLDHPNILNFKGMCIKVHLSFHSFTPLPRSLLIFCTDSKPVHSHRNFDSRESFNNIHLPSLPLASLLSFLYLFSPLLLGLLSLPFLSCTLFDFVSNIIFTRVTPLEAADSVCNRHCEWAPVPPHA